MLIYIQSADKQKNLYNYIDTIKLITTSSFLYCIIVVIISEVP